MQRLQSQQRAVHCSASMQKTMQGCNNCSDLVTARTEEGIHCRTTWISSIVSNMQTHAFDMNPPA